MRRFLLALTALALLPPMAAAVGGEELELVDAKADEGLELVTATAEDTVDLVEQRAEEIPGPGCDLICNAPFSVCRVAEHVAGRPLVCGEAEDSLRPLLEALLGRWE